MDYHQRQGSRNRTLSNNQILQINEYVLQLMEEIGCAVDNIEALDLLGHAGCDIADPRRVKIPRKVVKEALEAAPKEIQVFDRDGALSMTFTEDSCYYGTGSDCPTTIDLISGERRESTKNRPALPR